MIYVESDGKDPAVDAVLSRSCIVVYTDQANIPTDFFSTRHPLWYQVQPNMTCADCIKILDTRGIQALVVCVGSIEDVKLIDELIAFGVPVTRIRAKMAADSQITVQCDQIMDFSNYDFKKFVSSAMSTGQRMVKLGEADISAGVYHQLSQQSVDIVVEENVVIGNSNELLLELFLAPLVTDRPDGLFATSVVSEQGKSLGIVYSSPESIKKAIKAGTGVYYSRSRREIWQKGLTSGAQQKLHRIDVDCDRDALQFCVSQQSPGFCHLETTSCFGPSSGLHSLMETLQSRLSDPLKKSYTNKLFANSEMLHSKIREEAQELCDASTKEEIIAEVSDLLYFALAKCVKNGVSLVDIENCLELRSKKVTRRPGLTKPSFEKPAAKATSEVNTPTLTMQVFDRATISQSDEKKLLQRPIMNVSQITSIVAPIIESVRQRGDAAVLELTKKFDGVDLKQVTLSPPFTTLWKDRVSKDVIKAIDLAFENIKKFHVAQLPKKILTVETMPGVTCSRFSRSIERVGLYVPGGSAVLPSTALMLGIPAMVAQCREIVLATPPQKDGQVCAEVLYVAEKIGASKVVMAGGAQAVAAMAYGTQTVPKVDKICGPGNQFVTAAKMMVQNDPSCLVSIDMPAGPSEVLVIADAQCNPAFVASDLLSQAEHGPDSQVVLLTVEMIQDKVDEIQGQITLQANKLSRCDIVKKSLAHSYVLKCATLQEAMEFSNSYAPEHLILHIEDSQEKLDMVTNAGSVFLGKYSAESCGDYASGTNHTLPTYGYAKMYSGVNTDTFLKHITSQYVTADGLMNGLGEAVATLAAVEQLDAHRNAILIRLKALDLERQGK